MTSPPKMKAVPQRAHPGSPVLIMNRPMVEEILRISPDWINSCLSSLFQMDLMKQMTEMRMRMGAAKYARAKKSAIVHLLSRR